MWYRLIPSKWLQDDEKAVSLEGQFTIEQIQKHNEKGYNIYYFPNCSSYFQPKHKFHYLSGEYVDLFNFVFVDLDLKDGKYESKEQFLEKLLAWDLEPTAIVDSGNGVHAYWKVSDLDAMSFLRLQRRLCRFFDTDEAVAKLAQLMRAPGTLNTKDKNNYKECKVLFNSRKEYTAEDLSNILPRITAEDEEYCQNHYNMTHNIGQEDVEVSGELPDMFIRLSQENEEINNLFYKNQKDRSAADYRLAHLLRQSGMSKDDCRTVLFNTAKAAQRSSRHRYNYANNIVEKVYTYEETKETKRLSKSVKDILSKNPDIDEGNVRFPCHPAIDGTIHGFRLTEILGLVGGTGIGKTTICLNIFKWFVERNPEYIHVFVSLEQPEEEIALRWAQVAGKNSALHEKVEVLTNYEESGEYRHFTLEGIKDQILALEAETNKKVGCVVIDHIGVVKPDNRGEERSRIESICSKMKAFAVETNTFLIMQSQAPRGKAGIGDLELDKDAAYGSTSFEWYCDYMMTLWQPLKRVYHLASHMTVTAFKFCKIRHKKVKQDRIKEDVIYALMFDEDSEGLRQLTEDEFKAYDYWNKQATSIRNQDKKTEPAPVIKMEWEKDGNA